MDPLRRRRRAALIGIAGLLGLGIWAHLQLDIGWSLEALRELVIGMGVWGPVACVLLLTFRMAILTPSKILLVVAGICFGSVEGTLYGALGIAGSGWLVFGLTRWLGIETLRSRVPPRARKAIQMGGTRGGAGLVGLATGYPIGPLTAWHVGAALTTITLPAFSIALVLGSLVRAGIYAYFGNALVEGRVGELVAVGVVFVAAALPLLHPRTRAWMRSQFELPVLSTQPVGTQQAERAGR